MNSGLSVMERSGAYYLIDEEDLEILREYLDLKTYYDKELDYLFNNLMDIDDDLFCIFGVSFQ